MAHKARRAGAGVTSASEAPLAASFAGQIRSEDGTALASAGICATAVGIDQLGASRAACAIADGQGRYTIVAPETGAYTLMAFAASFLPGSPGDGRPIVVGSQEQKAGIDIILRHGGAELSGVVIDATGGPIANARIRASRYDMKRAVMQVNSDAQGRFVLWASAGNVDLEVFADGYVPIVTGRLLPSRHNTLTMMPGSRVRGRVLAESDGTPVGGILVRAFPKAGYSSNRPTATTDSTGTFAIDGLEPNAYVFTAEGEGWRGQRTEPMDVGLADFVDSVDISVSRAFSLRGKIIVRSSGLPCTAGAVTLVPLVTKVASPASTTTIQPDGAVRFGNLVAGTFQADVACADHILADGPVEVTASNTKTDDVVWEVVPGMGLVVQVRDANDNPIPYANFVLQSPPTTPGEPVHIMPLWADAQGNYRTAHTLRPGQYIIRPPRREEGPPVTVDLHEGTPEAPAVLRLSVGGVLVIHVRTPTGEPVDSMWVTATAIGGATPGRPSGTANEPNSLRATALGEGTFRVGPCARGRYRIEVQDPTNPSFGPDGAPAAGVEVRDGTTEVTVTVSRPARIRGTVIDDRKQPAADVAVTATCTGAGANVASEADADIEDYSGPPARPVYTDAEGRFELTNLRPKVHCTVRAQRPLGPIGTVANVQPGDDVIVAIPASATLSGTAVSARGEPIRHFILSVRDQDTGTFRTQEFVSNDGRWNLTKVHPGQVSLVGDDRQGGRARQFIALAPGQSMDGVRLEFAPFEDGPSPPERSTP